MGQSMLRQRGFSLIEALIALVVLSIGLIGVAAMQLKALQSATAGYQRTVVSVAAMDAQEQLWAELPGLEGCAYINTAKVEEEWVDWWENDEAYNPLRNVNWAKSSINGPEPVSDCEFTILIVLDNWLEDIETNFSYTFRLPLR